MKTIEEVISLYKSQLSKLYEAGELNAVISLVFNDVAGLSKTDLVLKKKESVPVEQEKALLTYLEELKTNKPVQYVLGYAWFFGLKMKVNEHVLIPRPETEELVKWILETRNEKIKASNLKILDIGTGSGCIAIALKDDLPDSDVYAMDVSNDALKVARENAELNHTDITFIQGDILNYSAEELRKEGKNKIFQTGFDIIVSNPPYILKSEISTITEREKNFEPHRALFVDDSADGGLAFYKHIAEFAKTNLARKGHLFFEINEKKGKDMVNLLQQSGYKNVELQKDISGNDRMIHAVA